VGADTIRLDEADRIFELVVEVLLTETKAGPVVETGMVAIPTAHAATFASVIIEASPVVGGGGGEDMCSCVKLIGKDPGEHASGCHIMGIS
jgi:hypothetical protein